ncbi:MAG: hypothetical protein PHF72_10255 [Gammaproteobacteria bacterium]|nr:hypothetical protein [Gammaproteobacteria bacterium]
MSDERAARDTEESARGRFPNRTISSTPGMNPLTRRACGGSLSRHSGEMVARRLPPPLAARGG